MYCYEMTAEALQMSESTFRYHLDKLKINDISSKNGQRNNIKFTQNDKDILLQIALKDRSLTFHQVATNFKKATGKNISAPTVSHCLCDFGLKRRKKIDVQYLTSEHMQKRLQWCQERKDLVIDYWSYVLFSDESMFREIANGIERVIRYDNEKLLEDFVKMNKQSCGMHWMVGDAFNRHGYRSLSFDKPKQHMTSLTYINLLQCTQDGISIRQCSNTQIKSNNQIFLRQQRKYLDLASQISKKNMLKNRIL